MHIMRIRMPRHMPVYVLRRSHHGRIRRRAIWYMVWNCVPGGKITGQLIGGGGAVPIALRARPAIFQRYDGCCHANHVMHAVTRTPHCLLGLLHDMHALVSRAPQKPVRYTGYRYVLAELPGAPPPPSGEKSCDGSADPEAGSSVDLDLVCS